MRGPPYHGHGVWFFGSGDLPRRSAYTIGYRLACLYAQARLEPGVEDTLGAPASAALSAALALWDGLEASAGSSWPS